MFRLLALPFFVAAFSILPGSAALSSGSEQWQALPWIRADQAARGIKGGEGCQQIQDIATNADGSVLLFGTDVGGIYRSTDQGGTWSPSNIGFAGRGARSIMFDPKHGQRAWAAACGGGEFSWHGLYLSDDAGVSWKLTFPLECNWGTIQQIAFDTRRDKDSNTEVVYWSANSSHAEKAGLYRSYRGPDGDGTWQRITGLYSDAFLEVTPAGDLWIGDNTGLWVSHDKANTFVKVRGNPVRGLALSPAEPDTIWACEGYSLVRSPDNGRTWENLPAKGLPTTGINDSQGWLNLFVSPLNPKLMFIQHQNDGHLSWEQCPRFVSQDGGDTWQPVQYDLSESFFPERIDGTRGRLLTVAFDPVHANTLYMNGCDFVVKSTDGGKLFKWSNGGYGGVMCFSRFNFNPFDPDLILYTSQDYNAALTTNAGKDWIREDVSGQGTYGFVYGGYAFDRQHLFAAAASSWTAPRYIYTSSDGGTHWLRTDTHANGGATDAACPDPTDPNVAFWSCYRTNDQARTWSQMPGCEVVFTYSAGTDHALFGSDQGNVVTSHDHGISWTIIAKSPFSQISDLAYDHLRQRIYVCGDGSGLSQYDLSTKTWTALNPRLPKDNQNHQAAKTVCVDPVDPSIVYIGNYDFYATSAAVCRSRDAGATWDNLTKSSPREAGLDGAHEAACVRVDPKTRDLYVTTNCYGNWRLPFRSAKD